MPETASSSQLVMDPADRLEAEYAKRQKTVPPQAIHALQGWVAEEQHAHMPQPSSTQGVRMVSTDEAGKMLVIGGAVALAVGIGLGWWLFSGGDRESASVVAAVAMEATPK